MLLVFKFFVGLLLLSLHVHAYAKSDFELAESIKEAYPQKLAILEDYARFMRQMNIEEDLHVRLKKVNSYINALVPKHDSPGSIGDYWASRIEFLSGGGGDCEDYVITKYQSLQDLGFAKENMGFCVAQDSYLGSMHMVLGVSYKQDIWILDNLSFRVLPYKKRKDLRFYGCLTQGEDFSIAADKSWGDKAPQGLLQKYEKLLEKIEKEQLWR